MREVLTARVQVEKRFYYLYCGVLQGSPASEKSRNNTREKWDIIFTYVWYRQSATDTSHTFRVTRPGWLSRWSLVGIFS